MSSLVYDLNEKNFMIYAMKHYDSPHCTLSEFDEDLKRVKWIKRLIGRYETTGELKERMILNHITVLSNVFGADFTTRLLLFKLDQERYPIIKAFLLYLQYLPREQVVRYIDGNTVNLKDITMNQQVVDRLRII